MYDLLANQRSKQIKDEASFIRRHSNKQINNLIYYSIKLCFIRHIFDLLVE